MGGSKKKHGGKKRKENKWNKSGYKVKKFMTAYD